METFWAQGFEGTSVDDLCRAMDMRPASLYGAFGDKRGLFLAALERYMRRSQCGFADAGQAGGMDGVRAFFARLVDRLAGDETGRGCLATNSAAELARRDGDVARLVAAHWDRLEAILTRLLDEARSRGQLADGAGPHSARVLVCLAQGLNVMAKTRPSREALQALVDAALQPLTRPARS